ncbi:hypothetical protein AAG906_005760 [Vitis piasezkii]
MGTNKERIEHLEAGLEPPNQGNQHHEGHNGGRLVVSSKTAKLEFPRFSGDDPTEWFNRVNQFFEFQNTPDNQKVSLASYHLEGEANQWWQWIRRTFQDEGRVLSWIDFEEELWARFGPSDCEDFDEALSRIRQTGSMRDYQREFEQLGNRVKGWTQKALVGTFMGGLKTEISDGIRWSYDLPSITSSPVLPPRNQKTGAQFDDRVGRKCSDDVQGLCFNCNERYEDDNNVIYDEVNEERNTGRHQEENLEPEITLHALTGWSAPKTMRVAARIGDHDVIILIDSGSTHNFLSERLANLLRLPVIPTETFPVRVANGESLKYIQAASLKELTKECRHQTLFTQACKITTEFSDLFIEPSCLPPPREVDPCINLKEGTEPINVRPYRYAHYQKNEIEKQVQDMLQSGLVQTSTSPFSSPVLLVKKKDGNWRFGTDYRALNAATIKDRFPIPTVDDMLDELHGASARVKPSDIHKTAFRTHNGHYEYLVMPFGLCNAPSTFQAIMNSIFRPHLRKFILVFFDDILIYSPDWDHHLLHVRQTFEILRHRFFVKDSKCAFGQQELEYLGHIITSLPGYYRKFVKNYGIIARPLTNLLKKGQFGWHEEAERAFLALKRAMTTTPILAMPNFNESFTIETDASGEGIGAVLSQCGKPVAYMSRALGVAKKSWSTYAKEMLAIIEAIPTPEQQKWVAKLLGYDYEITYKPGRENSTADALSRKQGSPVLQNIFFPQVSLWEEIKRAAEKDPYIQAKSRVATEQPGSSYTWCKGLLRYKGRIIVPNDTALRAKLLHEMHDTKVGGHSGVLRTFKKLRQQFYWPGMHGAVQNYVKGCEVCQKIKTETLVPAGLLQPLPIPCQVWDDISLDFIEGLPTSQGRDTIMVVRSGSDFHQQFWQEFFKMSGTKLKLGSSYHPQTDGQTEVVNRYVEQDHDVLFIGGPEMMVSLRTQVDQQLMRQDELLRQLKVNLEIAESNEAVSEIKEGGTLHSRENWAIAYKLKLPTEARIHPVFHRAETKRVELPPFSDDGVVILEPQTILDYRWLKQGTHLVEEGLVQWKHLPPRGNVGINNQVKEINDRPRRSTRLRKPNPKYLG